MVVMTPQVTTAYFFKALFVFKKIPNFYPYFTA